MLGCRDIVEEFGISKVRTITKGGDKRTHTVQAGLCEISAEADVVLIHDAARPLVREEHIREVIQNVIQHGAAALGVPAKNTIKQVDADGFITATLDREYVWEVQTPQGFRPGLIRDAYARAEADGVSGTDDCFIAERSGIPIKMVRGEYDNLKITTPEDLAVAEQLLLGEEPLI